MSKKYDLDKAPCGNWILDVPAKEEIHISDEDRAILRKLAREMADFAALPLEDEKRKLWTDHNDLKDTRPLIFCDAENGWNEIIPSSRLTCKGELARDWERWFLKELCYAKDIKDDKVIEAVFYVPYAEVHHPKWGLEPIMKGDFEAGGSYTWEPPIKDLDNLDEYMAKMRYPIIEIDEERSNLYMDLAKDTFDGILEIKRRHKWWHGFYTTLDYADMRGLEELFYDFYDYPDEVHRLMAFFRDGYMNMLDQLEQKNLLQVNTGNTYIGTGGLGFTSQLPGPDKTPATCADMWGNVASQEVSEITPEMFEEFCMPYEIPLMERFGMSTYGCCEPVDRFWDSVKKVRNLRRVSVSAWANVKTMAEMLGKNYVYSYKPSPSPLAVASYSAEEARPFFRDFLQQTKGCHVELIMKDNHTLGGRPENMFEWSKMVREEINKAF